MVECEDKEIIEVGWSSVGGRISISKENWDKFIQAERQLWFERMQLEIENEITTLFGGCSTCSRLYRCPWHNNPYELP